jgi:hypothetical protein
MLLLAQEFEDDSSSAFINELKERIELIKKTADEHLFDHTDNLYKDLLVDRYSGVESFSPHRGYVNLLPLALGMISPENSQALEAYA